VRCQRKFLKPPPGQKKLIKFPKKVLPVPGPDGQKFDEAGFYCWTFDKPTPTWVYIVSALCAVGVILICLFPVAPSWIKIGVVYMLSGILALMVGSLLIRGFIALTSYIFTGNTVWILPNVLDDNKPVSELFTPLIAIEEPDVSTKKALAMHWLTRVLVASAVGVLGYVLYTKSPGQEALKKNTFKYRDELFEFLNVHNTRNMIGNAANKTESAPDNTTTEEGNTAESHEEL
jgi:translocation protein SEC62